MIIVFLLIMVLILLLAGLVLSVKGKPDEENQIRLPRPIRILLSILLVVSALFILGSSGENTSVYSTWVLGGMLLSFIGDLAMAKIIPFRNRIAGGMLFFALAHGLYITAYIRTLHLRGLTLISTNFFVVLISFEAVAFIGWRSLVRNPKGKKSINAGSLLYTFCVAFMASTAVRLALTGGSSWWVAAVGAILFVISDSIIAVTKLGKITFKYSEIFVWLTYVSGQVGIIYSPWIQSVFARVLI